MQSAQVGCDWLIVRWPYFGLLFIEEEEEEETLFVNGMHNNIA